MTQPVQSAPPGDGADEFRLDGYVALVTGAGRGIGAGIARAYARAGADLVLVARTATDLDDVAAAVRSSGRTALVIPADLTDVSRMVTIVERAVAERGRLDILVNNAGGAMPASYLDTTPEALEEAFHFNVAAPFELTRQATPYLLGSGRGSVVNITSRMDRLTARGMVTYGTVKAAFTQLTRLLAVELAPGVRVNGIAPGVVDTDGLRAVLTGELRARIVSATPLHRLSPVDHVAHAAGGSPRPQRATSLARSSRSTAAPKPPRSPTTRPTSGRRTSCKHVEELGLSFGSKPALGHITDLSEDRPRYYQASRIRRENRVARCVCVVCRIEQSEQSARVADDHSAWCPSSRRRISCDRADRVPGPLPADGVDRNLAAVESAADVPKRDIMPPRCHGMVGLRAAGFRVAVSGVRLTVPRRTEDRHGARAPSRAGSRPESGAPLP